MARNKNNKARQGAGSSQPKPKQSAATSKARTNNVPTGYTSHFRNTTQVVTHPSGNVNLKGSELIGLTSTAMVAGDIVYLFDLSPGQWTGTRASTYARMFESFKIKDMTITVVPTCANTTPGLVFMYFDRDPNDGAVGNVGTYSNLSKLMSSQGAVAGPVWQPLTMRYQAGVEDRTGYFTQPVMGEGDLRATQQGLVYVYSTAPPAGNGSLVKVDYNIEFFSPTTLGLGITPSSSWYTSGFVTTATTSTSTNLPITTFSPSGGADTTVVYELLLDNPINVTVGTFAKTIAQYTPIYLRYAAGSIARLFVDLASAMSENGDGIINGAPSNLAYNGIIWAKVVLNLLGAQVS